MKLRIERDGVLVGQKVVVADLEHLPFRDNAFEEVEVDRGVSLTEPMMKEIERVSDCKRSN